MFVDISHLIGYLMMSPSIKSQSHTSAKEATAPTSKLEVILRGLCSKKTT
jgi:hypothetical protein